ncbi:calpain-A-like [Contarinia nasturtii]|uniref:calpain-A-like n=1 Tax=Contarinia nasturtii TaxID=265458 RepID=UPI0012D3A038|nr:calpain-A-like [Contarinia nasturtii]
MFVRVVPYDQSFDENYAAYAKLNGSYKALIGGSTCEAMEDFTGDVTEIYKLEEAHSNLFFNILLKGHERDSMMACSIDPSVLESKTSGLIRGHAYSITKIALMDIVSPSKTGQIQMVRLRNPWGDVASYQIT